MGVRCSEDIDLEYELPATVSTPQRELLHSASRTLQITQPPRYTEAIKGQASAEVLPDDIVFGACKSFGACCQQLSRDSERCCYRRGFTSARGLRALVRLLDGAAVACLAATDFGMRSAVVFRGIVSQSSAKSFGTTTGRLGALSCGALLLPPPA